MGLAASQARFLGLTARKTNVEYQGQQINQQRTALSNEIMGLYSKYQNLEPPVAPTKQDFVETKYTLGNTLDKEYELTNFTKIIDGPNAGCYDLTLKTYNEINNPYSTMLNFVTLEYSNDNLTITINDVNSGGAKTYSTIGGSENKITIYTSNTLEDGIYDNPYVQTLYDNLKPKPTKAPIYYGFLMENGKMYYTNSIDFDNMDNSDGNDDNTYKGKYTFEYIGTIKEPKTITAIGNLSQEESGRLSSVQIIECEEDSNLIGKVYPIDVGQESDEIGYQDALNQWEYDKLVYERNVESINAETKKLQEEDRSLELQLNQLDTEQKALSTEMESISKVIEETIDSVFKTFSG